MIKCDRKNKFEILGPAPAIISKIKNNYRERIFVKHKDEEELKKFVLFCVNFMIFVFGFFIHFSLFLFFSFQKYS